MEGDEHARLRRLVAPAFTPASANRLRPRMRSVVNDLVDQVAGLGTCELVADVCEPYPIPIICELLGAPPQDWKLFSAWATDIFRIFNANLLEDRPLIERAAAGLSAYVQDMIEERRTDPRDDLLSDMIAIEEEGDRLSTEEMAMLAEAVLMAGTDTTRNQLACSVALFSEHPDQWALLAEQPELAPRAVEESMRYLGAVRGTARFASEDVVYRDVLFPMGTLVSTSLAGANRDPDAWEQPEVFDITQRTGHRADDLRRRHPLLHGSRPGPGGAPRSLAHPGSTPPQFVVGRDHRVEALDVRDLGTGPPPAPLRPCVALLGPASHEGGQLVGRRRTGWGLDHRPERSLPLRAPEGIEQEFLGKGQELSRQLRVQIGRLPGCLGQVPAVRERVRRGDVHEGASGHLAEWELHDPLHGAILLEGREAAGRLLGERGLEVARTEVRRLPGRTARGWLTGRRNSGEKALATHDVVDQFPDVPRGTRGRPLQVGRRHPRQHFTGRRQRL